MSLSLLLPLGLAALAALLLPLLIHLARRSEQQPVIFAALRWLRFKPKPRQRIRFDEWPLLLLRLLLLALLALLLARPVLTGRDGDDAWVVVVPGVEQPERHLREAGFGQEIEPRWLAPGYPALNLPQPIEGLPAASLLRQLDAELSPGTRLVVFVPEVLDGVDAQRPVLSRAVEWRVVAGAPSVDEPAPGAPPAIHVLHDQTHAGGLRYLQAAARAWSASGEDPPVTSGSPEAPIPAGVDHLFWLSAAGMPDPVREWTRAGGVVVLSAGVDWPGQASPPQPLWRDARGRVWLEGGALGEGRVLRFTQALEPAAMPVLLESDFPQRLRQVLQGDQPPPARVSAGHHAPSTGGGPWLPVPYDLQPWLALLIALVFALERCLATARRRAVSP